MLLLLLNKRIRKKTWRSNCILHTYVVHKISTFNDNSDQHISKPTRFSKALSILSLFFGSRNNISPACTTEMKKTQLYETTLNIIFNVAYTVSSHCYKSTAVGALIYAIYITLTFIL